MVWKESKDRVVPQYPSASAPGVIPIKSNLGPAGNSSTVWQFQSKPGEPCPEPRKQNSGLRQGSLRLGDEPPRDESKGNTQYIKYLSIKVPNLLYF
jgi:hypothetical protein